MREKVVIFHGFTKEELNAALKAVKEALGRKVDLIAAVTTPTSLEWKVKDLIEELKKEHRYFKGRDKNEGKRKI